MFSGTFWSLFPETEAITHLILLCIASAWVILRDIPMLPFFSCQLFEEEIQYTSWSQVGLLKKYRGNDSPCTYRTLHLYIYNEMVLVEWHEDFDPSMLDILRTNMTIRTKPCSSIFNSSSGSITPHVNSAVISYKSKFLLHNLVFKIMHNHTFRQLKFTGLVDVQILGKHKFLVPSI